MKQLHLSRSLYIGLAGTVIILVLLLIFFFGKRAPAEEVVAVVESGPVRQLVSVSGVAEAEQTAELAFPVTGIVESVNVKIGDEVQTGDLLVTLDSRALYADRQDAAAAVSRAVANRNELLSGPTNSARELTTETVTSALAALETTRNNEAQKVTNAYRNLLSADLTATSDDIDEDATPPTIGGTYTCDTEGTYVIDVFSSSAASGYSYRLSGIESGTYTASTEQAIPLGTCGLRIQFDPTSKYSRSQWSIEIPNTKSSSYVSNRNAHALAVTQAESAIAVAEQAVTLAESDATNQNAPARSEAVTRADAEVAQAQARLNRIDATIADRMLRAPFTGTITEIDILPGETVTSEPVLTLLANSDFEVTARIPEIDIGKLLVGQKVEMVFDARSSEILTGEIDFISLKATEIDGVAYYKAMISMNETPQWVRSGLNADVEIIVSEKNDGLRVPKRFVVETKDGHVVLIKENGSTASSTVKIELEGNDGYVAITGVNEGDILVAP